MVFACLLLLLEILWHFLGGLEGLSSSICCALKELDGSFPAATCFLSISLRLLSFSLFLEHHGSLCDLADLC